MHAVNEEDHGPLDDPAPTELRERSSGFLGRIFRGSARGSDRSDHRGLGWRSPWKVGAIAFVTYAAVVSLSYFFVMKPIWARRDAVAAKKTALQDYRILSTSRDVLAGLREGLMQGDQRMTVVAELQSAAREAGLDVIGEAAHLPDKNITENMVEYPVELRLRGTYHQVGDYLSLLSGSSRCLIVKEVELDSRNANTGLSDVTIVVAAVAWERS